MTTENSNLQRPGRIDRNRDRHFTSKFGNTITLLPRSRVSHTRLYDMSGKKQKTLD
jgi:hypothetical protein